MKSLVGVLVCAVAAVVEWSGCACGLRVQPTCPHQHIPPHSLCTQYLPSSPSLAISFPLNTTSCKPNHRLSQRGVLGDIVEEWEEWQADRLLQGLQAQNKVVRAPRRKRDLDTEGIDLDAPRQV